MSSRPTHWRRYKRLGSILAIGVIVLSIPLVLYGAEVPDETCLDCHDGLDSSLAEGVHRLSSQTTGYALEVGCVNCHTGGEAHIDDPSTDNITNPSRLIGTEVTTLCSKCHQSHQELDDYGFDAHSTLEINCAECHRVHSVGGQELLDDRAEFCLKCHQEMSNKLSRRSNHPVLQDNVTCLSCHNFTKRADHNTVYGLGGVCQDCHPDQGGPFLHEHAATQAYAVTGSHCVECHNPHGSENNRLLRQPGNQMCRSCHVEHVTRNHADLWDNVWSKQPCQTCHTDTHGSFVSALYLDPDLPAKLGGNCYDAGCHSLNGQGGN
ncbi:MAG: cytochrome c3 family protein [candidate division Zixibacteria bacterium]|nr:cytochrome c3 family protein [candidate division Zixibacteria bacterium]MDH3936188.1 cytochrome c3 family protein [candidate division Zixibacteria bacterium]MDH4034602.1 cytochrome c3 family protein [candidate division Zixibacteria bacterium]